MRVANHKRIVQRSSPPGLVLLQRLLHLRVGHLVYQLCQVLHADLGHRTRALAWLLSNPSIGRLPGLGSLLTVLNDHIAVNLVDLDCVREVRLLIDYDLIFELWRVSRALNFLLRVSAQDHLLDVFMAMVLEAWIWNRLIWGDICPAFSQTAIKWSANAVECVMIDCVYSIWINAFLYQRQYETYLIFPRLTFQLLLVVIGC